MENLELPRLLLVFLRSFSTFPIEVNVLVNLVKWFLGLMYVMM